MSKNASSHSQAVAFFDFDGTLTTRDTLMPFLKFVVGAPAYYAQLALVSPVLAAYFVKLLRNDVAKQIVLKQYLAGYHIDDLFGLGQRFAEEVIPTLLRPVGMERLRWHQAQGHECVLVSASMDVYLNAWAKREHFSEVICTRLAHDTHGHISGSLAGANCYGAEKLRRVKTWRERRPPRKAFAYGDSPADTPLLNFCEAGFILKHGSFSPVHDSSRLVAGGAQCP